MSIVPSPGDTHERNGAMTGPERKEALATTTIHGGREPGRAGEPVVTPLVQSANYLQEVGVADGLVYPRYGNAPNAEVVLQSLAARQVGEGVHEQ